MMGCSEPSRHHGLTLPCVYISNVGISDNTRQLIFLVEGVQVLMGLQFFHVDQGVDSNAVMVVSIIDGLGLSAEL